MADSKPTPQTAAPAAKPAAPVVAKKAPAAAPRERKPRHGLFESLSVQEKINFARHLAMVVKAGLPVYQGLKIIRAQTQSKTLLDVIDKMMVDINNGRSLADSLEFYEGIFGGFFINIIRVGEASGTLSQNLIYLSQELRKSKNLQTKVRSAMVYPAVILVATIGVTTFLTFFVFPKLLPVLQGLNVKLPPTTRALIAAVQFLQADGIYLLIGLVALFIIIRFLVTKVTPIRYALHRLTLAIPVVGNLTQTVSMVNMARILALLLKSGVKIVDALQITSGTFTNLVYQRAIIKAEDTIRGGGTLADYLSAHPRLFPPLLAGMIEIGEGTGNLEENLQYLSEYYEDEVDTRLERMTSLLEPIMLLFMGLLVGFVAISIITPIYSISQGVH